MRKPLIIFVLVALFMLFSCETEEPDSIFDPNATAEPNPEITSIDPPDSAYGGADERFTITVTGQNFGDNAEEILVNFGSKKGSVVSHSATQMEITPPAHFTDSLRVMVSKYGSNASWEFGTYEQSAGVFHPYKLLNPVEKVSGFDAYTPPQSICVDGAGNVFVTHDKAIEKVLPDGSMINIGELRGKTTTRLLVGPDGALYYTYSKNVMKVDTSAFTHEYDRLNETALDMAFDQNDSLFAIDANAIYSVNYTTMEPTELVVFNDEFPDTSLVTMRVYGNDLYLAGTVNYETAGMVRYIWKVALDGSGGLTDGELVEVFDWSATDYDDVSVTNITFNVDGQLLVGSTNYAVLVIYPAAGDYASGEIKEMYADIIGDKYVHRFYWGPDDYLYISTYNSSDTENAEVLKVNMFGTGAPYYGRN